MKKILIQLIGGQLLPNIFSVLSLRPDEVHNICTPQTEGEARRLAAWLAKYSEKHDLRTISTEYSVESQAGGTFRTVAKLIATYAPEEDCIICLNMTGGTKLMSVAAVQACLLHGQGRGIKIPVFYVNTAEKDFEFVSHPDLKEQLLATEPFADKLSVEEIIASGETKIVGKPKDWKRAYPAAKAIMEIAPNIRLEADFKLTPKNVIQLASGQPISSWTPSKDKIRELARYAAANPAVSESFESLGIITRCDDFYVSSALLDVYTALASRTKNIDQQKRYMEPIQAVETFFCGGWWEVCVAQYMELSGKYTQILWSVETALDDPKKQGNNGATESDIIASDGIKLTCVSCKRGKREKGMITELEQHYIRSVKQGGIMGTHYVAVYNNGRPPAAHDAQEIQATAKLCKLSMLWGDVVVARLDSREPIVARKKVSTTIEDNGETSSPEPTPQKPIPQPTPAPRPEPTPQPVPAPQKPQLIPEPAPSPREEPAPKGFFASLLAKLFGSK